MLCAPEEETPFPNVRTGEYELMPPWAEPMYLDFYIKKDSLLIDASSLPHPLFPSSSGTLTLIPLAEEFCAAPSGPFPAPCSHLSKCPFIKLLWNYPNLNVPFISCWNTAELVDHGVCHVGLVAAP